MATREIIPNNNEFITLSTEEAARIVSHLVLQIAGVPDSRNNSTFITIENVDSYNDRISFLVEGSKGKSHQSHHQHASFCDWNDGGYCTCDEYEF